MRLQVIGWVCAGIAAALFFVVAGGADEFAGAWVRAATALMVAAVFAGIVFALLARRQR
jgi:hypothetical protein